MPISLIQQIKQKYKGEDLAKLNKAAKDYVADAAKQSIHYDALKDKEQFIATFVEMFYDYVINEPSEVREYLNKYGLK